MGFQLGLYLFEDLFLLLFALVGFDVDLRLIAIVRYALY
jgi:hypothetical protein